MFCSGLICVSQHPKSVLYYETLQKYACIKFYFFFLSVRGFHIPWTILYYILKIEIWIMSESHLGTGIDSSTVWKRHFTFLHQFFLFLKLTYKHFFVSLWAVSVNNWISGCLDYCSHRKSKKSLLLWGECELRENLEL